MNKSTFLFESERILEFLREINSTPELTQRYLAQKCSISLGKTNFLLRALLENGLIKVDNFKNSKNKRANMYLLTPEGVKIMLELMHKFCARKAREYTRLKKDIEVFDQTRKDAL